VQQRTLGSSGLGVSAIGLGCMGMSSAYGTGDDVESVATIHRALALGVSFLDTSDVYGPYTNEELVGRAIAGRRDEVVLASKVGLIRDDLENYVLRKDASPAHIRSAIEESLRRLRADVIDLYYLHRVDPEVPLEESYGAMAELVAEGKVRALGLSEVDVPTLERAMAIHPVSALQSELSLWTRDALADVVPWCAANDVAFVPFAPLGRGFLTGSLAADTTFAQGHFRHRNPRFQPDAMAENQAIVERVRAIAEDVGATPAQVAIAWVLAQGDQVIPIPGTKRQRYLEENVGAVDVVLGDDALAELDGLPAPAGTRY
jgi:aryl-alcohol dehydrogenase-like predicted oxidoreductase